MLNTQELLRTLVNQLTDSSLTRLWRTGTMFAVVTASDDDHTDVSPVYIVALMAVYMLLFHYLLFIASSSLHT